MSVTLTDEKHAELVRMLDTIVRGCDAHAYDIGLSLDPLRDLLKEVAALTREPAPTITPKDTIQEAIAWIEACTGKEAQHIDEGTLSLLGRLQALTREPAPLTPEEENRRLADSMMCRCGRDGCWACGGVFDPGPLAHLCARHSADPGEYLPCLPIKSEPAPCPSCDGVPGRGVEGHHERCVTRLGGRAVWGLRDLPAVDSEPAPCPHRELMREAVVHLRYQLAVADPQNDGDLARHLSGKQFVSDVQSAIASAQPCAPAACAHGDLQECYSVEFGGYLRIMDDATGSCAALAEVPPCARVFVASPSKPCAAPAGCQHRERLREAFDALPRECCKTDPDLLDRIEATLKQSCAAPGEAGEWSEAGLVTHKFKAHYDVAGSCTEPLSNIAQDGDYIRVYEPRYRRRAPEREGGAR